MQPYRDEAPAERPSEFEQAVGRARQHRERKLQEQAERDAQRLAQKAEAERLLAELSRAVAPVTVRRLGSGRLVVEGKRRVKIGVLVAQGGWNYSGEDVLISGPNLRELLVELAGLQCFVAAVEEAQRGWRPPETVIVVGTWIAALVAAALILTRGVCW